MSNESMTFDGRPVRVVHVRATVEFDAYVFADYPGDVIPYEGAASGVGIPVRERVMADIADAIEYHAGYGKDSEPGDATIALHSRCAVALDSFTDTALTGDVELAASAMSDGV